MREGMLYGLGVPTVPWGRTPTRGGRERKRRRSRRREPWGLAQGVDFRTKALRRPTKAGPVRVYPVEPLPQGGDLLNIFWTAPRPDGCLTRGSTATVAVNFKHEFADLIMGHELGHLATLGRFTSRAEYGWWREGQTSQERYFEYIRGLVLSEARAWQWISRRWRAQGRRLTTKERAYIKECFTSYLPDYWNAKKALKGQSQVDKTVNWSYFGSGGSPT